MTCTDHFDWTFAWQEGLFGIGLAAVVLLMIVAAVAALFWWMGR